jgi:hypothetical protein
MFLQKYPALYAVILPRRREARRFLHAEVNMGVEFVTWSANRVALALAWFQHTWPYVTGALGLGAAVWRFRRWLVHFFGIGLDRVEMVRNLDAVQDQFKLSERARSSMRAMLDDVSQMYDRLADDLHEARARMADIEAMLEVRAANEWLLFQDRESALAWARDCAARLRARGDTAPPEPVMLGVPVAEPEEVLTERFHREHEDMIHRYGRPDRHHAVAHHTDDPTP